jgi:hypothetical protein
LPFLPSTQKSNPITTTTGLAFFSFKIFCSSYFIFSFAIRNERLNQSTANLSHHQPPYATVFFFRLEIEEPLWQVPYGLTKASGGDFKVDVGEQTDSEVKKQKKKQSQFLLQPITTTNKTFGSITNAYSSKIDTDSVVLANI